MASRFYCQIVKRAGDIAVSAILLIVLSPVLVVLAVIIRFRLGPPVLFRQVRPGLDGCPFQLVKFRTMTDDKDAGGSQLPDGARLTSLGRGLRSTSLDELPELWNVLRGDMSLVGPRPLLLDYLPLYTAEQARRHQVRPGLTGLAQVKGRNALAWDERFQLDCWYVDNISFRLDCHILGMTIRRVLLREGISAEGAATMPPFLGSGRPDPENM